MLEKTYRIAIFGLGTVGSSLVKLIENEAANIQQTLGYTVKIDGIAANNKNKERGFAHDYTWIDDAKTYIKTQKPDCVFELIGGMGGIVEEIWQCALEHNVTLITANKALIAEKGMEYFALAEKHNTMIHYEAAVAGGIPIIRFLTQSVATHNVTQIRGIMNGTCNFILSEMEKTQQSFDVMLAHAQQLGYAEAVPDFDIDGIDAGHKIAISCALTFGIPIDFSNVNVRGIRHVTLEDILCAKDFGYALKLIAHGKKYADGTYDIRVEPVLINAQDPLAHVDGAYNAVETFDPYTGNIVLTGQGAGGNPTASACLSDLVCAIRQIYHPPLGKPLSALQACKMRALQHITSEYFLTVTVQDKSGALAYVARILADNNISIKQLLQHEGQPGEQSSIMMTTHECSAHDFTQAFSAFEAAKDTIINARYYAIIN